MTSHKTLHPGYAAAPASAQPPAPQPEAREEAPRAHKPRPLVPAPTGDLSFSEALVGLKQGYRMARRGWDGVALAPTPPGTANEANMFVFLVSGSRFAVSREPLLSILGEGAPVEYRAHIDLRAIDGTIGTWTPSMTDLLADDWFVVNSVRGAKISPEAAA